MKRKWTLLLLIPTLLLALFLFVVNRSSHSVEIIGNLPSDDIAEIRRLVRRDLRSDVLPRISWNNIRRLPVTVKEFMRNEISKIYVNNSNEVTVEMTNYPGIFMGWQYIAKRGTNGWSIQRFSYLPGMSD